MSSPTELVLIKGESRVAVLGVTSDGCKPINLTGATDLSLWLPKQDGVGVARFTNTLRTFLVAAVSLDASTITITAHGLVNDDKTQLTTTGVLPTGLAPATDYYVIVIDEDTIQLTAVAGGDPLALTGIGSGIATLTISTTALLDGPTGLVQLTLSQPAIEALKTMEKGTAYLSYTLAGVIRLVLFSKAFTVIDPSASCGC